MKRKIYLFLLLLCVCFSATAAKQDTSKVEWIKVYFNGESDHSVALPGNKSNHLWDMMQPLIDRIDSAHFSVDLVAYDLQNMRVVEALARAKRRGVRVRVVTDNSTRNISARFSPAVWDTLAKNGIYSIDDEGAVYQPDGKIVELADRLPNAGAIMHHKFAVFDALSESPEDDYVWTGTMNLTYTGQWNTNATLVIKDSGISAAYLIEFEQMWGSKTEIPNANRARFHKNKLALQKNHVHYVNDTKISVFFAPMDREQNKPSISKIVTCLIEDYARHDVNLLAFAISPNIPISEAMIDRAKRGEIQLNGVIDPSFYARYRNQNDVWADPEMAFANKNILSGKEVRKLHSKILIIDPAYPYPDDHKAMTIVGSYNFSAAAELSNDENILLIKDNKIANQFYQDFRGVLSRAKGETFHRAPQLDTSKWYDNYRIGRDGELEIELETNIFYPVKLLGVDLPRMWGGHKDSTTFYAEESHDYLKKLVKGASFKISAGAEQPEHKFGNYYGYITAKKEGQEIAVNHQLLATGNATISRYNRQQKDSILSFKLAEHKAKEAGLGMWEYPDSVGVHILTNEQKMLKNLFPLDLNAATQEELELVKGIGPKTAQNIIEFREQKSTINNLRELLQIPGIGVKTLEKLEKYLYVEDE